MVSKFANRHTQVDIDDQVRAKPNHGDADESVSADLDSSETSVPKSDNKNRASQ